MSSTSPLEEVKVESIDILFDRDPLELSDRDIDQMVNYFRENRLRWKQEEKTKSLKPKRESAPKKKIDLNLSLDDLLA